MVRLLLGSLFLAAGCPAPEPVWFATCGDPSCAGHQPSGLEACDTQVEGDVCESGEPDCDRVDDCNTRLTCADEDPTEGGCPISLRSAKAEVRYLAPAEVESLHRAALDTRLATWRYRDAPLNEKRKLGFLIDDQPSSPAVAASGQRVDLYGYTSLAIAALQVQERRIKELEARLATLEAKGGCTSEVKPAN